MAATYRDPELYDAANEWRRQDTAFYRRYLRRVHAPVLELACGTGRIALTLARAGHKVWGIDLSEPFLEAARRKARAAGLRIRFVRGDVTRLRLGRRFGAILLAYNSIQHIHDLESLRRLFSGVRKHLRRGGLFLLDVVNPNPAFLSLKRARRIGRFVHSPLGTVVVWERHRYDRLTQVNHVTFTYKHRRGSWIWKMGFRCFYPEELRALLESAGFRILRRYGDFQGKPFRSDSPVQIIVATPRS